MPKGKKPPTFRHLPVNRAKVLKKQWVESQKIRSKWKATRRKEGLGRREGHEQSEREDDGDNKETDEDDPKIPDQPPLPKRLDGSETRTGATSSLRGLAKEAYSPSSLHTFKSDPLHRRKRQPTDRAGGSQTKMQRGKARGQPNMKLRMDVLLEKIKRDFT